MFLDNKFDTRISLNLPGGETGIRNNHDLFIFLLDLLCKGIVLLYGDADHRVPIDALTQEQLAYLTKKMANAGIVLTVDIVPISTIINDVVAVKPCIIKGANDELHEYKMRIVSKNIEYTIRFSLRRV